MRHEMCITDHTEGGCSPLDVTEHTRRQDNASRQVQ